MKFVKYNGLRNVEVIQSDKLYLAVNDGDKLTKIKVEDGLLLMIKDVIDEYFRYKLGKI